MRRTRVTLLVGFLVALAVLAWLAAHPATYSSQLGHIISDNLLRRAGAALTFKTLSGNPLRNLTFYDVSITRPGEDGSFVYVTADSLAIDYDLRSFFSRRPHLRSIVLGPANLLVRRAAPSVARAVTSARASSWNSSLSVDYARLDGVDVTIAASSGEPLEELQGVQWVGSARLDGEDGVRLHAARLGGEWSTRSLRLVRASFDAGIVGREVRIEDAVVELDSTLAQFGLTLTRAEGGGVESATLDGEAEAFLLNEVLRLLGKDPGPRLQLAGAVQLQYRAGRLDLEGSAAGWLESFPVRADEFRGSIDSTTLRLHRVHGAFLSTEGDVAGALDLASAWLRLKGSFSQGDLSDPWTGPGHDWPVTDLSGELDLQLATRGPLELDLRLEQVRGTALELPVDSAATRIHFAEAEGLKILSADARVLGAHLHGSGTVGPTEQVEVAVTARAEDAEAWARRFELPVRLEKIEAVGRLSGLPDSLALRVGGSAQRLETHGVVAEANQFVLELPRFEDLTRVGGEWRSGASTVRSVRSGSVLADFRREGTRVDFDQMRWSLSDTTLAVQGAVEWGGPVPVVEVDSLEVRAASERWWLEQPSRLALFSDGLETESLRLRSDSGRVAFEGSAHRDSTLDLKVWVDDGDLAALRRLGIANLDAEGRFDAVIRLSGSLDALDGEVDITVDDAEVGGRSLDSGNLGVTLSGASIAVETLSAHGELGVLGLRGSVRSPEVGWPRRLLNEPDQLATLWRRASLDLSVRTDSLDAGLLSDLQSEERVFGLVSADLTVTGTPRRPRLSGRVRTEDLRAGSFVVPRLDVRLVSDARGVSIEGGTLGAPEPWLQVAGYLPLDLSFSEAPRWNAAEGLRLNLWSEGEVSLTPFEEFWPLARHLSGTAELRMLAEGDPSAPEFSGTLRIRDGGFGLEGWSERLRDAEVEARFAGDRLVIDRLEAREGAKGRVRARGEVIFRGLLPDDVWADVVAERVLLASVPYLRAIGSSQDLQLRLRRPSPGAPRAPHLTGTVQVDKAIYTGEFTTNGSAQGGVFAPNLTPLWTADLAIHAREQVRISNQSAELRVEGDVDVLRDTAGLRFRGTGEIPRGRVPLFNNDFSIVSGTLDFSRRPLEPEVDITAETEVPIYDPGDGGGRQLERITIHLTGTFAQPQVEFRSENGLDENSILRLLAGFGGPSGSTTVSSGVSDMGLRAGLNFLERALAQRVGGVDTIDIETEESGVSQMQSTRIAVGKYLSENLYLRLSQGLSITERDLFLEYQISRRVLFTSELRRRLRENGAENQFNVDMKFRVKY